MARRNIEIILGGLVDAVRNQDPEHITEFLAADLVWEGLAPGLRCDRREQAMGVIRHRFAAAPLAVEAVEAIDAGQHVIVGLRGPGFNGTPGDLDTVGPDLQRLHPQQWKGHPLARLPHPRASPGRCGRQRPALAVTHAPSVVCRHIPKAA